MIEFWPQSNATVTDAHNTWGGIIKLNAILGVMWETRQLATTGGRRDRGGYSVGGSMCG